MPAKTCASKKHRWSRDGRRCLDCGAKRTRMPEKPTRLVPLAYGTVYCELCHCNIATGQLVGWRRVQTKDGRKRWTAYCPDCHHANVRNGRPLR